MGVKWLTKSDFQEFKRLSNPFLFKLCGESAGTETLKIIRLITLKCIYLVKLATIKRARN